MTAPAILRLGYVASVASGVRAIGDQRRRVFRTVAAYFDSEHVEYRKAFETYDEGFAPPTEGTHATLNALARQWGVPK